MEKFDELTNENSCLNKAEADEPIFVLRANDPIAPGLVRKWSEIYARTKSAQKEGMSPRQVAKHEEALRLADRMDQWRERRIANELTKGQGAVSAPRAGGMTREEVAEANDDPECNKLEAINRIAFALLSSGSLGISGEAEKALRQIVDLSSGYMKIPT